MRFIVHISEKRKGHVLVDAETSYEAMQMVKKMIARKEVREEAWGESMKVVTHATHEV